MFLALNILNLFPQRTKYLWTPYVCMFTAFGVCSPKLWMTLFKWLNLKSLNPIVLVRSVLQFCWYKVKIVNMREKRIFISIFVLHSL